MGYTKGPWEVINGTWVSAKNPYGHDDMHIADVRGWGHLTGKGGGCSFSEKKAVEIVDANARLISAAPELLNACENVIRNIEAFSEREGHIPFGAADVVAAIKKAKGEK
jgi:hypothetical protein